MISEISKRLTKGGSLSPSLSCSSGGSSSKPLSDSSSTLSSSSNSSKSAHESIMLTEPETFDINLFSASTTSIENDPLAARENCFKRRKIDELTYAASRVKEDIEKGGLAFPLNHTDKPRALEGTDIDMSSIRLLGAKSVADSPFLNPICGNKRSFQSTTYDFEQLFSETQRAYSKRWIQDVQTDWGDRSSVGSLTSDSECSLSLDIPPRLEDGLNRASATDSCSEETSPALNTVQMSTALENTSEPRLVTLLFAPFLVIHVNAAYARMTGIEARQVLGKPLSDVFKDNRCKSIASNVSSLVTMDEQLTSVQSKGQSKRSNCRLHVSLVGTESDTTIAESEPVGITHYMIAVEPTAQTGLPTLTESNVPPAPVAQSRVHCEVVG